MYVSTLIHTAILGCQNYIPIWPIESRSITFRDLVNALCVIFMQSKITMINKSTLHWGDPLGAPLSRCSEKIFFKLIQNNDQDTQTSHWRKTHERTSDDLP